MRSHVAVVLAFVTGLQWIGDLVHRCTKQGVPLSQLLMFLQGNGRCVTASRPGGLTSLFLSGCGCGCIAH